MCPRTNRCSFSFNPRVLTLSSPVPLSTDGAAGISVKKKGFPEIPVPKHTSHSHSPRGVSSTTQKSTLNQLDRSKASISIKGREWKSFAAPRVTGPVPTIHQAGLIYSIPAVAVFARALVPGRTKTRLIPALGPDGAAEFHRALVSDALRKVARLKGHLARYLFVTGGSLPSALVPTSFECRRQVGSDLGQRMGRAFAELLRQHSRAVVIGTDSPGLVPSLLRLALEELRTADAVLGPCPDGGYYLIGLRRTYRDLLDGVRLGTEFAFRDTVDSLLAQGFSFSVLESCLDIDLPQDLVALRESLVKNSSARRVMPQTWRFLSKMGSFGMGNLPTVRHPCAI